MPVLPQQRALDTQIPAEVQLEPSDVLWKDRRGQCLVLRAQTPLTMLGRCIIPSLPKKKSPGQDLTPAPSGSLLCPVNNEAGRKKTPARFPSCTSTAELCLFPIVLFLKSVLET